MNTKEEFLIIMSKLHVLYKQKRKTKKTLRMLQKNEDLLSKCQEQVQVSPLPPSTSKLIKTGAK